MTRTQAGSNTDREGVSSGAGPRGGVERQAVQQSEREES